MTALVARHSTTSLLARLLDDPELPARVRGVPPDRFGALVREVGVADAGELVALATTEQLVAAFDEDLFVNRRPGQRETFDRRRFVTWLEVLLEAGDAAVARRVEELDEEFVAHALSALVRVFDHEALRERIVAEDEGEAADRALEHALCEEIDGYLLVARDEEGWDAVLALVLALDRRDRGLLVRVLDRCAAASAELIDDLEALTEVLTAAETLAEDVEAAREARRSAAGYVEPRAARAFLALARRPMIGPIEAASRDANTRAYFRERARAPSAGRRVDVGARPARLRGDDRLGRALAALGPAPAPASSREPLDRALVELGSAAPAVFEERLAELAYLANVVLAAATTDEGLRYTPAESAEVARYTWALGAELVAFAARPAGSLRSGRATARELDEVLRRHPADRVFRVACAWRAAREPTAREVLVRTRAELDRLAAKIRPRVVIVGNSGAGKSTLARALGDAHRIPTLDLDAIAWSSPGVRREPAESTRALQDFFAANEGWVVEGCYASLVAAALPHCSELVFLDPGVEVCLAHNRARPWEPHKYPSSAAQDANLEMLARWVREYHERDDEYSHCAHLAIYDGFAGKKVRRTADAADAADPSPSEAPARGASQRRPPSDLSPQLTRG